MMSLLLAIVRFAAVVTMLVWLPGWIVTRRPLARAGGLQGLVIGSAVHVIALGGTALLTARVDRATWLLPLVTFAVAFVARAALHRAGVVMREGPRLPPAAALAVAVLVAMAAVLRLLHNYHYDDLQHLNYLTALERQNMLFPQDLMLALTSITLPGLGEGSVMLSRYPLWAASCVLLGRLSAVVPGDVYLLVGLGALALALSQISSSVSRAWSPAVGVLWIGAIIAAGPVMADSLLNYGGYPFQMGKLFVLAALSSVLVAWRSRRGDDLIPAACGLIVAPLLHTNNAIGSLAVLCLAAPMVFVRSLRRPAAGLLAAMGVLAVLSAGAFLTGGFVRWLPASTLVAMPPSEAPPSTVSTMEAPPQPAVKVTRDPVARRLVMFMSRGAPSEVVFVFVGLALAPLVRRMPTLVVPTLTVLIVSMSALVLGFFAVAVVRQALTVAMKPGYFRMRSALIAVRPAIDPSRGVLTDPITDVFGRAAGWPLHSAPPLDVQQQSLRLLVLHPAVTGDALQQVLAAVGPSTLVVNEQVIGAGTAQKFSGVPRVRQLARWGASPPLESDARMHVTNGLDALYGLDVAAFASNARAAIADLSSLMWSRPLTVFALSEEAQKSLDPAALGRLIRNGAASASVEPFLNSAIVTVPATAACVQGVALTVRNRSSFDSPLLLWPLDRLSSGTAQALQYHNLGMGGTTATMEVPFSQVVCEPTPFSLLVHSSYWWDFRFAVEQSDWKLGRHVE